MNVDSVIESPEGLRGFEGWADVEIMGHRRRTGEVRNALVGDRVFVEIREPPYDGPTSGKHEERVEIYSPTAVFALSPLEDESAAVRLLCDRDDIPF
jgi:hypothetical protein